MNGRFLIIPIVLFWGLLSCSTINTSEMDAEGGQLLLEVFPQKDSYSIGKEITIEVRIINTDTKPIMVRQPLSVSHVAYPSDLQNLNFEVTSPSGEKLGFLARVSLARPDEGSFVFLYPSSGVIRFVDISKYYSFSTPGTYLLTVQYINTVQHPTDEQLSTFVGELRDQLEIEVE